MFELVLPSVISIYFVALILLYFVTHFFGIGRERQPNRIADLAKSISR